MLTAEMCVDYVDGSILIEKKKKKTHLGQDLKRVLLKSKRSKKKRKRGYDWMSSAYKHVKNKCSNSSLLRFMKCKRLVNDCKQSFKRENEGKELIFHLQSSAFSRRVFNCDCLCCHYWIICSKICEPVSCHWRLCILLKLGLFLVVNVCPPYNHFLESSIT